MKIVYIDLLFLSNLIPDYLLLRLTAAILGVYVKPLRTVLGAVLGGVLSVPLYFMTFRFPLLIKCLFCLLICLSAFGKKRLAAVCTLFCALSFAFCGACSALSLLNVTNAQVKNGSLYANISFSFLMVACVFAYCLLRLVFGQGSGFSGKKQMTVQVVLNGNETCFTALSDTGNTLRHPFSNKRIIVAGRDLCAPLFEPFERAYLLSSKNPADAFEALSGTMRSHLTLVPYTAAGGSGLMLVIKPDKISIDGKDDPSYLLGVAYDGVEAVIGV